jgi:hypothetical protein
MGCAVRAAVWYRRAPSTALSARLALTARRYSAGKSREPQAVRKAGRGSFPTGQSTLSREGKSYPRLGWGAWLIRGYRAIRRRRYSATTRGPCGRTLGIATFRYTALAVARRESETV